MVRQGIALATLGSLLAAPVLADNWSGSLRSKLQTDNRYHVDGDYTGEVWAQLAYDNPEQQLTGRLSTLSRVSSDIYRQKQDVYQAYLEKNLMGLPLILRGGRFERSDSMGLYLLDGGSARYRFGNLPLSLEFYGGRPVRTDHVRSLQGNLSAGMESLLKLQPHWSWPPSRLQVNNLDLRMGWQVIQRSRQQQLTEQQTAQPIVGDSNFDAVEGAELPSTSVNETSYRFNGSARLAGHLLAVDKPLELFVQGSYATDKNRLENVFIDGWWDALKRLRLRNYFEAYRPRQPFVAFRDRFYSAYALGEQRNWRGSAEYGINDKLRASLGLQYADRERGYSGSGYNAGLSFQWRPALTLRCEFDYLELVSGESAASFYWSANHALTSKTRYTLNLAFRREEKLLSGSNQARGIENEWQYMLDNSMVLAFKGSYIDNSALDNEYLAAMQLTYYFDRFQAKKP
jgi:hypothetical protein